MVGFEVDLQYSILNPEIGCFTNFTDFKRDFMHYIQITVLYLTSTGGTYATTYNLTPRCMAHRLPQPLKPNKWLRAGMGNRMGTQNWQIQRKEKQNKTLQFLVPLALQGWPIPSLVSFAGDSENTCLIS